MKTCDKCQTENPADAKFCRQCGRAFPPPDATVRWSGESVPAVRLAQGDVPVATLFGPKDRLVVGRAEDCDVCLPHPLVSRYHALAERKIDGVYLRDLASVNGVWLNGKRLKEAARLADGDRVGVGPFLFTLKDGAIHAIDNSVGLRLEARRLVKTVPVPGGRKTLLDDVNLVLNPGEFVSLLGPSGSGKSTLMDCLNGRRRATGGQVLANGEDFYRHFDNFRQSLGYVPQKDIVHGGLTVYKALFYTAKLRLPADTTPDELQERVEAVLREMELLPHRDTAVERLSGGQVKRVSLGAELLARPSLLYIDEATSGLDAGTEARMMRLFRRLSDEGRSLICITHNLENVDQCHLILVLARGRVIYFGPPAEAPKYFKVPRISDVYDRIAERDLDAWSREYRESSYYHELVLDRLAAPLNTPAPAQPPGSATATAPAVTLIGRQAEQAVGAKGKPLADRIRQLTASALDWRNYWQPVKDAFRQFGVLTARYVELIRADRRGLWLLLLQAPIVALIVLVAFYDKDYTRPLPSLNLSPKQREVLAALVDLQKATGKAGPRGPEAEKALDEATIRANLGGVEQTVTGLQLVRLVEQFQKSTAGTQAGELFDQLQLTYQRGDKTVSLTRAELENMLAQTRDSGLLERISEYAGTDREVINPRFAYMLLFIVVVVVMWFGCNNASKEIVKEEAIYSRERAVNLGIFPYLASKFLVQVVLTAVQVALLLVVIFGVLHLLHAVNPERFSLPPAEYVRDYGTLYFLLFLLGTAGVALGLALSACVDSPDKANALLPYVMIPQLIFGGGIMAVGAGLLYYLAGTFSSVYWAYRAVHTGTGQLPAGYPGDVFPNDDLGLPVAALLLQTVILLVLTLVFLKRKDVR